MRDDSYVSYYIGNGFYKVDENYKILKGHKYEVMGIDSNKAIDFIRVKEMYDGLYFVEYDYDNYEELPYSEIKTLLPTVISTELDNLQNKNDVINLSQKLNVHLSYYEHYNSHDFDFGIPVVIKQTLASEGYKTNDLILLTRLSLEFRYDENDNINFSDIYIESFSKPIVMLDDFHNIPKVGELGNIDYETDYYSDVTCLNKSNQGTIITDVLNGEACDFSHIVGSCSFSTVNYFVEQKGEVKLEIENTVNGVSEFIAKNNKELEYKIIIRNTGNATSGNNIIETIVADEVVVIEETISDDGVYNKADNTIVWKIDNLGADEKYTFTYSATISENADKSKTYIGKSTVSSNQSDIVHSKETKVYLSKSAEVIDRNNLVNPNTYSTAVFGIVTVVLICLVIGTYLVKYRKNNN